jgi:hypothetical protein
VKNLHLAIILFSLTFATQACLHEPVSVQGGGEMQVLLHVTGGFAGADYVVLLDGEARELVGVSCVNLCDFDDGETLRSLTAEQVEYVWALFQEAGIYALDGEDFGVQCCDQFHFDLDYRDGEGRSRVSGSSEALPQDLKIAIATIQGMVSGTLPVIVNFGTNPELWPGDAFQIQDAVVSGHALQVTLSYGGGCRFDDPCDAWITRVFTFDLIPMKLAYQGSYGVGEPGKTTLILLLEDPMLASPQGARWLEYIF